MSLAWGLNSFFPFTHYYCHRNIVAAIIIPSVETTFQELSNPKHSIWTVEPCRWLCYFCKRKKIDFSFCQTDQFVFSRGSHETEPTRLSCAKTESACTAFHTQQTFHMRWLIKILKWGDVRGQRSIYKTHVVHHSSTENWSDWHLLRVRILLGTKICVKKSEFFNSSSAYLDSGLFFCHWKLCKLSFVLQKKKSVESLKRECEKVFMINAGKAWVFIF